MKYIRCLPRFIATVVLGIPGFAQAASTIPGDATGLWFDALHPGWGMNLVQQNDAAVATLFIYDASGRPAWYVASRLEARVPSVDSCGVTALEGTLYRTQWPNFAAGVDPHGNLQVTAVGSITFYVATDPHCDLNTGEVLYSIDGAGTTATVARQTWGSNQARLYGQFAGGLAFPLLPGSRCTELIASILPADGRQLSINGSADDSNPAGVRLAWGTGLDTACEIRGTYSQGGQFGAIAGTLSCGPIGGGLSQLGEAKVSRLYAGDSGFVGDVSLNVNSCAYSGALSGARRP
ncbi:MAG: hypothetical protein ACXWF0_04345 [Usitatibacter sp.]